MTAKSNIRLVQQALAAKGFSPGNIDGLWGSRTEAAVRAFQATHGLVADGIVGPKTLAALGVGHAGGGHSLSKDAIDDPALPWLLVARHLLGVRETPGNGSNRQILDWATDLGIPYKSDDIAWCGLFVAHCIGTSLSREPLPANPLGAQNWKQFGGPCAAQPGAILVFWRDKPTSWKGHVGFYVGEDAAGFYVLGGNQGNQVSVARIAKNRLLAGGVRWPATAPLGTGEPRMMAMGDGFGDDEA
jgi:uncharacterized protein (TIGR02594 family)